VKETNKFIEQIEFKNYKSIKDATVKLTNLNILIGANGAGKSNFISFFNFFNYYIRDVVKQVKLFDDYVARSGGADKFITFGELSLEFEITLTQPSVWKYTLQFYKSLDQWLSRIDPGDNNLNDQITNTSTFEEIYNKDKEHQAFLARLQDFLQKIGAGFHFDRARDDSPMNATLDSNDHWYLRSDGGNIAGMLKRINKEYPKYYDLIVQTIRMVVPDFLDFVIHHDTEYIQLEWLNKYYPDKPLRAHYLSDGSLRFICLATLLLMPVELQPEVIIIDEPELGLHPYAISILADLIWRASQNKQLIVATQSPLLLERFTADDIIIVDKDDKYSQFKRLNEKDLGAWLEKYNPAELWQRGIIGGQP
jgi:predicted ATPase